MATKVEIGNMALSYCGTDLFVESFEEGNKEAKLLKLWYPICRDMLLRKIPWNFATRRKVLGELSVTPPSGWAKQYRYPTDCARLWMIYPTGCDVPAYRYWQQQTVQYKFEIGSTENEAGRDIYTNLEDAEALYTAKITDTGLFDELFVDALATMIATKICIPMVTESSMVQLVNDEYTRAINAAWSANADEGVDDGQPEAEATQARFDYPLVGD